MPEDASIDGTQRSSGKLPVAKSNDSSQDTAGMNGHARSTEHASGHATAVATDLERGSSGEADHKPAGRGMVLPFSPITVTFSDLHYFVPLPEVCTKAPASLEWDRDSLYTSHCSRRAALGR